MNKDRHSLFSSREARLQDDSTRQRFRDAWREAWIYAYDCISGCEDPDVAMKLLKDRMAERGFQCTVTYDAIVNRITVQLLDASMVILGGSRSDDD